MSDTKAHINLTFRPDLQGLRALAVFLVILSHAEVKGFLGGFVGVDVFFVLSGYLITGLLLREMEQDGSVSFLSFYSRRIRRLFPAMMVMLISVFFLSMYILSNTEAKAQLASAPFAATWTSNFYYAFTKFGYFEELAAKDLFVHTWSLAVEEQFYLIWPVLLLIFFRLKWLQNNIKGFCLLFIVGLVASVYLTEYNSSLGFYMMPSRIWQFALGGGVYIVTTNFWPYFCISKTKIWVALIIGGALILGSSFILHPGITYPGVWALAPSLGAALIIVAGHALNGNGPLAHPVLVWLGDRSYSLYLWHWPVLILGSSIGFYGTNIATISLILTSLLLAIISYRLVEYPFWKGFGSQGSPKRVMLIFLLAVTGTLATFFHGLRHIELMQEKVDPSMQWRMDFPRIYRMGCDAWYSNAQVKPCVFDSTSAKRTVVLLGDSIGAQWFSLIPEIFKQPDWRTVVLTKSSCPIVDVDFFYPKIGTIYKVCSDWRNAVIDTLIEEKPDVLVIGNAATVPFTEGEWTEGTSRILKRLHDAIRTIIIIPGTPSLGFDGPSCIVRNLSFAGKIERDACIAKDRMQPVEVVKRYIENSTLQFSNVHILDLNDIVCPGGECNAVSEDGLVVFRDSQHLTDTFVRSRVPAAKGRIEKFVNDL